MASEKECPLPNVCTPMLAFILAIVVLALFLIANFKEPVSFIQVITNLVTILAIILGAVWAVCFYLHFCPSVELRVEPRWVSEKSRLLIVRVEVENKSRVQVPDPNLQILVVEKSKSVQQPDSHLECLLSEWVDSGSEDETKNRIMKNGRLSAEPMVEPLEPRKPEQICRTSEQILPGEVLSVERLYHCPNEVAVHIRVQLRYSIEGWTRRLNRKALRDPRWTVTRIALKDEVESSSEEDVDKQEKSS